MRRIHIGDRAAGDLHRFLVARDDVDQHAGAAVASVKLALEVAAEIPLGAVAGRALNAVQDEVQIAGELTGVVSQRAQAQVHGIAAGGLEQLRELDALFDRDHEVAGSGQGVVEVHERRVVGEVVVFLDAIDEHLHDEVVAASSLDLRDALGDEAGAILQAADAVLVGARVVEAREEVLADVEAGRVDFERLEAHALDGLRKADADILDLHDVVDRKLGHIAAHVRPLQAERRAVLRALVDQTLAEVSRIGRGLVPGDKGSQFALDPDELDAALRHIDVVLEEFLGEAGQIRRRSGGGLDHAMARLDGADLDRREERAEIRGVLAVIGILRVDVRCRDELGVVRGRPVCARRLAAIARGRRGIVGRRSAAGQPRPCGGYTRNSEPREKASPG